MARNYNSTSNANEDKMFRQLADDVTKGKKNEEKIKNMYSDSYQNTWSPMSSQLTDFDPMGFSSIYTSSKIDIPTHSGIYQSKRRNTLPHSSSPLSSSHISSLKAINRFNLEKIPEIVVSTSSTNDEQVLSNSTEPGPSTSKNHKFIVTPTDTNVLEK